MRRSTDPARRVACWAQPGSPDKAQARVLLAFIFSIASAHDGRGPVIALAAAAGFAAVVSVFSPLRLRLGAQGPAPPP